MNVRYGLLLAAALPLLALAVGCQRKPSRPIGVVGGKVTVGDAPVSQGMIIFDNEAAGIATTAPLGLDGTYTVRTYNEAGLPVGHYRVAVSPQHLSDGKVVLVGNEPPARPKLQTAIPEKYRTVRATPLTADVKEGDNPPFDFRLTP